MNKQSVAKMLKVHVNAQAKEYDHSPSDTFWENHGVMQLAPMEGKYAFLIWNSLISCMHFFFFLSTL